MNGKEIALLDGNNTASILDYANNSKLRMLKIFNEPSLIKLEVSDD
jgi:hypothetical protein